MSFSSVQSLLTQLAWPSQALNRRGTLTWTNVLREPDFENNPVVSSAVVLVSDSQLTLRCRTAFFQGELEPLLEAKWSLNGEAKPVLVSAVRNGTPVPLNEEAIVGAFQDRVNLLGVRPQFQAFAERQPLASNPGKIAL